MPVRVVLAAGLVVVAAALAVLLLQSRPHEAGSNYVMQTEEAARLLGRDRHCQAAGLIPGDTAALRLLVGTFGDPTPQYRVTVRDGGRVLSAGALPAGQRQGEVVIPLDHIPHTIGGAELCIASGPGRRTVLYGQGGQVRTEWLRPGSESWAALTPTIAHRFGLGKALTGGWLIVLAALLLAGAWVAALWLLPRELEEERA